MIARGHLHERCPDQAREVSGGIKVLQKYILFIYIRFDSGPRHSGAYASDHHFTLAHPGHCGGRDPKKGERCGRI